MTDQRLVIVHAVPGTWLPQTQTWLYNQVRFLPQQIESHIVCERVANPDQFHLPNIHPASAVPSRLRHYDQALRKLRLRRYTGFLLRLVRAQAGTVIHSHFGTEGWRNIPLAKRLGTRHVVTFYGYDVNHLPQVSAKWRRRYRELFNRVDLVLCEGEHMAGCIADLGCAAWKVYVHRLGIDLDGIHYRPRKWNGSEPLRVMLAASFREKKGLPFGIEALGQLQQDVELQITIIGDATAAPGSRDQKHKILAAIEHNGLNAKVTMIGFQTHEALLAQAYRHHLFLAPSITAKDGDTEGGAPMTIIEMAASGMPIVSTHHCDIPGVVKHGVTGYLAKERDIDDLCTQLRRMIGSAEHWPTMLRNGREWIEHRFDAVTQGKRLAAIYAQLLSPVKVTSYRPFMPMSLGMRPAGSSRTAAEERLSRFHRGSPARGRRVLPRRFRC